MNAKNIQGKSLASSLSTSQDSTLRLKKVQTQLTHLKDELDIMKPELKHLLDAITPAIRIINKDHSIRLLNRAFAEMAAVDRDEIVGQKCFDVFPNPLCHTKECRLVRALDRQKSINAEIIRTKPGGTQIPCIVTASPVIDVNGKISGVIEQFKDITEKRELTKQLQESEERYRALIDLRAEAGEAIVMLQDIDSIEGRYVLGFEEKNLADSS